MFITEPFDGCHGKRDGGILGDGRGRPIAILCTNGFLSIFCTFPGGSRSKNSEMRTIKVEALSQKESDLKENSPFRTAFSPMGCRRNPGAVRERAAAG
jgi:hypothetical protein